MSAESADPIYTLPLFPLHHVLFPQFLLRLHVFEERYKAMIGDCIARGAPFGVVLIRSGEEVGDPAVPHQIGCMARILEVEPLEEGQMNLLAVGEGRFRLLDYREAEPPYLIGRAESMEDVPASAEVLAPLAGKLTRLFTRYLGLLAGRAGLPLPEMDLPDDPTLLAFCIASVIPLSSLDKQRILEMTDAPERLRREIRLLRRMVAEVETLRAEEAPEKEPAGGGIQTVKARPMNQDPERWQRYRHDGRN
ncbi:MAG TPA: LON peptidase substrate-binding domain-containing protein [Chthonomonadaceae bacterium]|nr:LON peptidase substrate-binding domain-containing protein [Chthonomonadaceae bacterium]